MQELKLCLANKKVIYYTEHRWKRNYEGTEWLHGNTKTDNQKKQLKFKVVQLCH